MVSRRVNVSHVRPLDISRDLMPVADILEQGFEDEMDALGQRIIRQMRLIGRWGGMLAGLGSLLFPDASLGPGFVWVDEGQVRGTLSLRRAETYDASLRNDASLGPRAGWPAGSGWLIGNVAVKATHRRRGIARALMNETIEHVRRQGGKSIRLLVRADNLPAVRLYSGLGFRQTGALAYWQRPPEARRRLNTQGEAAGGLPREISLRRARSGEWRQVYDLASAGQAVELDWAEPVRRSDFYTAWDQKLEDWIERRRRIVLVAESRYGIAGVVQAIVFRPPEEGRLRVWVGPDYCGRLEAALLSAALRELAAPLSALVCTFLAKQMPMYTALAGCGFLPTRILAHMRLDLH
ncbi:MAG: GNAT family N-acetyltransferase [Thermoflexales bacterium]|nr:GNAT family N-acetyltransferase [Thermoflexales bacterium]